MELYRRVGLVSRGLLWGDVSFGMETWRHLHDTKEAVVVMSGRLTRQKNRQVRPPDGTKQCHPGLDPGSKGPTRWIPD